MKLSLQMASASIVIALTGCALPPVKLSTPEPVKVDINVRLDVYQHGQKDKADTSESPNTAATANDSPSIEVRRRNRMGDIQLFKNSRIIGENRNGLLDILTPPPGEYGEYIRSVVDAENEDRLELMKQLASQQGISIEAIQSDRAKLCRSQAFQGEWIEEPTPGGSDYRWIQKGKSL